MSQACGLRHGADIGHAYAASPCDMQSQAEQCIISHCSMRVCAVLSALELPYSLSSFCILLPKVGQSIIKCSAQLFIQSLSKCFAVEEGVQEAAVRPCITRKAVYELI